MVQMAIGCAAKHKLTSRVEDKAERKVTSATIMEMRDSNIALYQQIDSLWHKQTLRLYPKGVISLGNKGFVGELDSLIWFSRGISYQKKHTQQEQLLDQSIGRTTTDSSAYSKKEYLKEKQKVSSRFYLVAFLVGLLGMFIYWRWRKC